MSHYHVAHGIAGYGPDNDEGTPTFTELGDALEYAREELSTSIDMAHESAHAFGDAGQFEEAWREVLRCEELETLRANLDPARREAPLYRDDPSAYAALQESQAADFPHDVSDSARLYLWLCSEPDDACDPPEPDECDGFINEPAYGAVTVSLNSRMIGEAPDTESAGRMLADAMRASSYWPNCWHVNERGNTTLLALDVESGAYTFTDTSYV